MPSATSSEHRNLADVTELDCEPNLPIAEGAQAKVVRVMDGDTIVVSTFRSDCTYPLKTSVRLLGYDAAEIHSKDLQEKQMGFVAKQRLEEVLLNKIVNLHDVSTDKYGRCLADISTETIPSISAYMQQDTDTCKPYDGGHKKSWHFSAEAIEKAPPIPPPQKRQLSPKRSPKRVITAVVTKVTIQEEEITISSANQGTWTK